MPWMGTGGFAFNETSVRAYAPALSGVYCLYGLNGTAYVGESGGIQARLLEHLRGGNFLIALAGPTLFAYELVPYDQRVARQDQLIRELRPSANLRLG